MPDAPRPPRPAREGDDQARADRRARALESPLDVRAIEDPRFAHLEVRNPVHSTRYDVVFPSFPSREGGFCTCTDFARRGIGTCKHLESAWLWVQEHRADVPPVTPGAPLDELWTEIDRRLNAPRRPGEPDPLRYRWPGAALLE